MLVVVYILSSCIHKLLLIMTQHHFYLLHSYSLYLFSCLQFFPFMLSSPQLRIKSLTIGSSAVAQSSLHLSHLIFVESFFPIVCPHFLSLGLLVCSLFSEAKEWLHLVSLIIHMVELSLLKCKRFSPCWLSCWAPGDWVSSLQSFLTLRLISNRVENWMTIKCPKSQQSEVGARSSWSWFGI